LARHAFFISSRPLVFAHRGGAALAPENTLAAFANGISLGADGIELDVRASRDGRVVVHHDETLERTTRLQGAVALRTAAELAMSNVPQLGAVLRECRDARLIIEIKVNDPEFGRLVVDELRRADAIQRACVGSFGMSVLRAIRREEPALATSAARDEVRMALYRSWLGLPFSRPAWAGYQVPERAGGTRVVSRRFVDHAHRAGLGVQVWTVDDEQQALRLLDWGVDGLITDRPDVIVPLVRASSREEPRRRSSPSQAG
jgi:glycerophosphoryl diester phosphodiesterase